MCAWLGEIGFAHEANMFAEHELDAADITVLEPGDFNELGIAPERQATMKEIIQQVQSVLLGRLSILMLPSLTLLTALLERSRCITDYMEVGP